MQKNGVTNVEIVASDGLSSIPNEIKFDVVVSNPPTHQPKETIIEFIEGAYRLLRNGGTLYLVTERRIKPMIEQEVKKVFGCYDLLDSNVQYALSYAQKM